MLIFSFFPVWLVTGPFLPDLILSLGALGFLYICFRDNRFDYFKFKPFYIFLAFCFVCIVSSLFSDDILLSFESSLFYFRFGIFVCLVCYLINKDIHFLKYFFYCLLAVFCFLIFDGYFQFLLGFNVFGQELICGFHVTSVFDRPKLGSFLARLFPLLLALMIAARIKDIYVMVFGGILFIFIDILVFVTGERTSFMYTMLNSIFIVLLIDIYLSKIFMPISYYGSKKIIIFLVRNFFLVSLKI